MTSRRAALAADLLGALNGAAATFTITIASATLVFAPLGPQWLAQGFVACLIATVIGGMRSLPGAVVGGFLLALIDTTLNYTLSQDLLKFRDYFSGLLGYVQKSIASGRSAAEIVKVASVPGFADYEGTPEGTIQAAYEELTAKG